MTKTKLILAFFLWGVGSSGCTDGDWFGPVERGLRAAFDGWDMWATDAVRPYEDPMPPTPEGTMPTTDHFSIRAGLAEVNALSKAQRNRKAAEAYRRYCHHCHGPNGDGRVIVGESLDIKPTDLRSAAVQNKSDRQLFDHLKAGGKLMIPLAATMSPGEMLLAIDHARGLAGRATKPHFAPRHSTPLER